MTKTCCRCKDDLPLSAFYAGKGKYGVGNSCKACMMAYNALRKAQDPERDRLTNKLARDKRTASGKLAATAKAYRDNNVNAQLSSNLRSRIFAALNGRNKSAATLELVGCSIDHLKAYLGALFQEGMLWDNYGEWHIDHKRPCASFDLTDPEQQTMCFHFTNLQPLWAVDNLKKHASYEQST